MPNNSVTLDPKQLSSLLKKIESFRDGTDPTILAVVPFCDRVSMEKLLCEFTYYELVTGKKEPESPDYHFFTRPTNLLSLERICREAPKGTEVIIVSRQDDRLVTVLAHQSWLEKPLMPVCALAGELKSIGCKFGPTWGWATSEIPADWRSASCFLSPTEIRDQIQKIRAAQTAFAKSLSKVTVEFP